MLQELLLCLAGYKSPLLQEILPQETEAVGTEDKPGKYNIPPLSPPERALLSTVARLGDFHAKVKKNAASISATHASMVCKAVASAITSTQLRRFMAQIVATERLILSKDSGYVGGHGIVPLSAVVGDFSPWMRRLEWLWEVVSYMQTAAPAREGISPQKCSGASIINFLRTESHTGYVDLEAMALELVKVAEMVWLQQLSTWVLYGKRPRIGSDDFFIQPPAAKHTGEPRATAFSVHKPSLPEFVSPETASSVLFIVQSLNDIRAQDQNLPVPSSSGDPAMRLLPAHLEYLKSVRSPISSLSLTKVIDSIRTSISQNALAQLLPLSQVVEALHVLQHFLLLGRGEFATSLISNADKWTKTRYEAHGFTKADRKASRFDVIAPRDGDFAAMLSQTWSELAAFHSGDLLDGTFDKGRDLLRIVAKDPRGRAGDSKPDFSSLVFTVPTSITLSLPPTSSLALFLSQVDLASYAEMNSYLLGIRRAAMRLESLWKLTGLRRSSRGLLLNCSSDAGIQESARLRRRQERRNAQLRSAWATASKAQFVLMELGAYLQGRIVHGYSQHFVSWVTRLIEMEDLPSHASGLGNLSTMKQMMPENGTRTPSDQSEADQLSAGNEGIRHLRANPKSQHKDAAALAKAHKVYLAALRSSLLLNLTNFTKALLDLLRFLDHFVALFERLQIAQQTSDLKNDKFSDGFAAYEREEAETLQEIKTSCEVIEEQLIGLVEELRNTQDWKAGDESPENSGQRVDEIDFMVSSYVPWRAPTMDSLLMKLDFVGVRSQREAAEDKVEEYYSQ